jgi:hypothetical protein
MSPHELINRWRSRAYRMQLAHFETARIFDARHLWLGLPTIVFSTLVGTTVFASLSKSIDVRIKILVGLLSVAAAVLAALQTFLKYGELSKKHQEAGGKFADLRHRLEVLSSIPPSSPDEQKKELTMIEDRWAKVRDESPTIPTRIMTKIDKRLSLQKIHKP